MAKVKIQGLSSRIYTGDIIQSFKSTSLLIKIESMLTKRNELQIRCSVTKYGGAVVVVNHYTLSEFQEMLEVEGAHVILEHKPGRVFYESGSDNAKVFKLVNKFFKTKLMYNRAI